jgi:streptogramin lyase
VGKDEELGRCLHSTCPQIEIRLCGTTVKRANQMFCRESERLRCKAVLTQPFRSVRNRRRVRTVTRAFAFVATVALLAGFGSASAASPEPAFDPPPYPAPTITEYTAPHQHGVFYPALGPDGNIWDVDVAGTIVRILTRAPYTVTEFVVPGGFYLRGIIAGPDGNLWFTDQRGSYDGQQLPGMIGRITPTGTITEFNLPNAQSTPTPIEIIAGPDGHLYFTEACKTSACYPGGETVAVGRIRPFGSDAEIQASVTTVVPKTSTLCTGQACDTLYWGITVGLDGSLWIAGGTSIDRLSLLPEPHLTRYPIPGAVQYSALDITTGIDGNVWFTGETPNEPLGRITPNGEITLYPLPAPATEAIGIRTGPDGNLWLAAGAAGGGTEGLIGTFSPFGLGPVLGNVTYYTVPDGAVPYGFANGPCDNTIWFTDTGGNPGAQGGFIGRVQLHTPPGPQLYTPPGVQLYTPPGVQLQTPVGLQLHIPLGEGDYCLFSEFGNTQGQ